MKKLTAKQEAALLDAYKNNGRLFQTQLSKTHSPATLSALVKAGLLELTPVGVVWHLTDAGREAVKTVY